MNREKWLELFDFCMSQGTEPVDAIVVTVRKRNGHYVLTGPNDGHFIPSEATIVLGKARNVAYADFDKLNKKKKKVKKSLELRSNFQTVHKLSQFVESDKE